MAHRRAPQADLDLDEIWYYIAQETGNVETARRQVQAITERFYLLATYPRMGRARDDLGAGRRTYPVGKYIILYRIEGADVLILRVAHSRRDLDTLFRE